ncbi:MAG TPA: 16S rRNA (guanine(966)-N(2))-methyltransferase RsmD [Nocardioidaceae bacterium]|nr:16S rRNA (guanine(966)-N(2))-methyltransferase RsmD [Nocardioidaceae bacterium]
MTRIIAGTAGGRRLSTPRGTTTRPTADRVREAVFSAVEHQLGTLAGKHVLDLYAGSGALGLEAVSRGATSAVLVEHDRRVGDTLRANIASLDLRSATLRLGRVERVVASGPPRGRLFDVVFLDPPYPLGNDEVVAVLRLLLENRWLALDALMVVERSSRSADLAWPPGLEATRSRRYGETCVWYGRRTRPARS